MTAYVYEGDSGAFREARDDASEQYVFYHLYCGRAVEVVDPIPMYYVGVGEDGFCYLKGVK